MVQLRMFRLLWHRTSYGIPFIVFGAVMIYLNIMEPSQSKYNSLVKAENTREVVSMDINLSDLENSGINTTVGLRLVERRGKIQEVCKNTSMYCYIPALVTFHQYLFYQYNTTICSIAKAGSSTWRAHLRRVNDGPPFNRPIQDDARRTEFLSRPMDDVLRDLNASSKIITVRHPLTRLVSAYRNKFKDGHPMPPNRPAQEAEKHKRMAGSYWDDRFHQFWLPALFVNDLVPSDIHLKLGLMDPIHPETKYNVSVYESLHHLLEPRITFVHFLRFVIKTFEDNKSDAHWNHYYSACCPCYFDYDYVTKVETLTEDLGYVFKTLGIPADPEVAMNQYRSSTDDLYKDYAYYQNVPLNLKREIYKYIKTDMDLFGYQLPKNFLDE